MSDVTGDFERIFGKPENAGAANVPKPLNIPAVPVVPPRTEKAPSDSDVLGIRTDSDRFIVKQMPERLPAPTPPTPGAALEVTPVTGPTKLVFDIVPPGSQEAMTIALNVSVVPKQGGSAATPAIVADPNKAAISFTRAFSEPPVMPAATKVPVPASVFPAPLPKAQPPSRNADGFDQLFASRQDTWMHPPARSTAPSVHAASPVQSTATDAAFADPESERSRFSRVLLTVLLLNGLLLVAVLLVVFFAMRR
ncbi:MAG TPA: hypothetical protein VFQ00_07005 [Terriglobales bacterium]|nr:hypothetical protein [Terriglobales bacterium]